MKYFNCSGLASVHIAMNGDENKIDDISLHVKYTSRFHSALLSLNYIIGTILSHERTQKDVQKVCVMFLYTHLLTILVS